MEEDDASMREAVRLDTPEVCEQCGYGSLIPESTNLMVPSPAFLLGAGASIDAGLPGALDLGTEVAREITSALTESGERSDFDAAAGRLLDLLRADFAREDRDLDIESLLLAAHCIGGTAPAFVPLRPLLSDWYREESAWKGASRLGFMIWDSVIQRLRTPRVQNLEYLQALASLRQDETEPLKIFSLNYDLCIETAFKAIGFSCSTGWVDEEWVAANLDHANSTAQLFKLHGSLDWQTPSGYPWIILGMPEKLAPAGPFWSLWSRFVETTSTADVLIVVGYGFRDQHVNTILDDMVGRGGDLIVVTPDFNGVRRWVLDEDRQGHVSAIFFGAAEALEGGHVLHALQDVLKRQKVGFSSDDPDISDDERLKRQWLRQRDCIAW